MNFKIMPELEWVHGYPYALVAMLLAGGRAPTCFSSGRKWFVGTVPSRGGLRIREARGMLKAVWPEGTNIDALPPFVHRKSQRQLFGLLCRTWPGCGGRERNSRGDPVPHRRPCKPMESRVPQPTSIATAKI